LTQLGKPPRDHSAAPVRGCTPVSVTGEVPEVFVATTRVAPAACTCGNLAYARVQRSLPVARSMAVSVVPWVPLCTTATPSPVTVNVSSSSGLGPSAAVQRTAPVTAFSDTSAGVLASEPSSAITDPCQAVAALT